MTVKEILTPLINNEFMMYRQVGYKIRLRSITKKRTIYSVVFAIAFLFVCLFPSAAVVFVCGIPIYIIKMVKTKDKVDVILDLARKSPDKPIAQIIAEEISG